MRNILITTALLCACAITASAQLGPVTVQATLKKADGTLCNGSITLAYPTFTSPDGQYNVAGSVTTTVTSGVLSVTLEPGGYSAQYALAPDGCGPSVELWGVPQSPNPVTLAQVTTLASGFCSIQGTLWPIGCGYGIGTALPAACSVGQAFFLTSASAGSNWYGCTTANTWTLEGGGGGGSPSFSAITNGTNTGHTLTVGNSTVLAPTGTGIINADQLNGGTVPTTTQFLGSNSSNQVIAAPYIGSALPGTCSVGQVFFLTSAMLGLNWYGCTSTNTWTQQGGSGGAGTPPYSVGVSAVSSYTIPETTHLQGTSPLAWLFGTTSTTYTVTGATNATPIVVTVSSTTGLTNSSVVSLSGVLGNTAANGIFGIGSVTGTTFTLLGSAGNGAWTSGGTVAIGSQAEAPNYYRDSAGDVFLTFNPPFSGVIEVGSGNSGGGGGGGGGGSFSAITSGVNSGGNTMTVGSTSTLTISGTGIINANEINSAQPPVSTQYLGTNSFRQLTVALTPLLPLNNLGDLNNVVTARTNLGLGTFALKNSLVSGDIPNNAANTTGNATTATMLATSPSQCPTGPQQFSTGITANGTPNCSEVSSGSISGVLGVAVGGTGTGTAFTPGSALFAGTGGVYAQDNGNFFWDPINHRLGLGTTTPASTLDVESTVGAIFTRALGSATAGAPQAAMILGLSNTVPNVVGGGPAFVFRASNNALGLVFTGRVGTAWENPAAGSEAASLIFTSRSPSDTTASIERMRIDSQGNMLIGGTTDAGYNLDVQDSGSVGTARFFNQTATTGTTRVRISRGAGDTTTTNTLASDASASLFGLSLTGLTTGSIPFIGASGLMSQDAAFAWSSTNHNLTLSGANVNQLNIIGTAAAGEQITAGSGNNAADIQIGSGGGGGSGDHAFTSYFKGATSEWITGGVWNGVPNYVIRDPTNSFLPRLVVQHTTGNVSLSPLNEGDSGYRLDVQSSGSSGTLRVWDQTASTGTTLEALQAGAGQSGNLLNINNNSGVTQASIDSSYHFNAPQFTVNVSNGATLNTSLSLAATGLVNWTDVCTTRNGAGILEIDNCTAGTYRDLILRNITVSGLASSGTQCAQLTSTGLLQGTGGPCPGGGGGGVSSVGLSMPTVLCPTITGSPVTTTGVLTCNIGTQSANTFLRGPTSGSAAAPAWGPLVAADLPGPGSTTQVAYNLASVLTGSANLTYVSPALTIGVGGATTGQLILQNGGTSGLGVTIQNNIATGAYNFNLPSTAGTAGNPLCSGGGSASPMTWCTVTVPNGGTGQTTLTNHGLLVGAGTAAVTQLAAAALGTILQGNGGSSDPSFTATPILGVAGATLGTLRFAGNTSGTVTVESAAAAGTWTMVLPTGTGTAGQLLSTDGAGVTSWTSATSGAWNTIANAVSPLTLANGTQATTFNQTAAVNWTWANTAAANSGASQSSPTLNLNGTYWNGVATASDGWTIQNAVGNGSNGTTSLTLAHNGLNTGTQTVSLLNTVAATSGTSQNSPLLGLTGSYWNGSAPASDGWNLQDSIGNGTNGMSTLNIAHAGSTTGPQQIVITNPGHFNSGDAYGNTTPLLVQSGPLGSWYSNFDAAFTAMFAPTVTFNIVGFAVQESGSTNMFSSPIQGVAINADSAPGHQPNGISGICATAVAGSSMSSVGCWGATVSAVDGVPSHYNDYSTLFGIEADCSLNTAHSSCNAYFAFGGSNTAGDNSNAFLVGTLGTSGSTIYPWGTAMFVDDGTTNNGIVLGSQNSGCTIVGGNTACRNSLSQPIYMHGYDNTTTCAGHGCATTGQIFEDPGGLMQIYSYQGSGAAGSVFIGNGSFIVNSLAGSGNAAACLNSSGQLYRSTTTSCP